MTHGIAPLDGMIKRSVPALVATPAFSGWFSQQKANDGDIVCVNNSFIYRKPLINTSKNSQYLCLKMKSGKPDARNIFIGEPGELNSDFKLYSVKASNLPHLKPLDTVLQAEIGKLGRLVFVLIGELQDAPAKVPVKHSLVRELEFDPSANAAAAVEDVPGGHRKMAVNQLTDPESAWNIIRPALQATTSNDLGSLETAFAGAFEKLQDEARLELVFPAPGASKSGTSFMARLRQSVSEQRKPYEDALRSRQEITERIGPRQQFRGSPGIASGSISSRPWESLTFSLTAP